MGADVSAQVVVVLEEALGRGHVAGSLAGVQLLLDVGHPGQLQWKQTYPSTKLGKTR